MRVWCEVSLPLPLCFRLRQVVHIPFWVLMWFQPQRFLHRTCRCLILLQQSTLQNSVATSSDAAHQNMTFSLGLCDFIFNTLWQAKCGCHVTYVQHVRERPDKQSHMAMASRPWDDLLEIFSRITFIVKWQNRADMSEPNSWSGGRPAWACKRVEKVQTV